MIVKSGVTLQILISTRVIYYNKPSSYGIPILNYALQVKHLALAEDVSSLMAVKYMYLFATPITLVKPLVSILPSVKQMPFVKTIEIPNIVLCFALVDCSQLLPKISVELVLMHDEGTGKDLYLLLLYARNNYLFSRSSIVLQGNFQ
jgi:hypothetical protein